jgi:transposase
VSNFRTIDRQTGFLLPPSVDEWLPEKHLARFVVEVIDGLDLRAMSGSYRGSGSASYHPRMLLGILVYGYATGVFSSRKLERATYDSVAFRFIAANDHPDHDTIAAFRRRFLKEIEGLFVQVLLLAREMGVLNMGTIGLDGTKIHANASRHNALSYEHAGKIEAQLQAEVAELMAKAEAADAADIPDGMSIPDELARREERLRKIAEARTKIEARAKERHAREMAEYQAKLAARDAKTAATDKKPGGKPPQPPTEGPLPRDQINLTDEDSRVMPVAGGGFEQCYNAQAAVAAGSLLVVAVDVVQAPNDKQQLAPMLGKIGECRGVREGRDRAADRHGPSAASSAADGALRDGAACSRESDVGRGDGASAEDAGRQEGLCSAQTDPGTGVRHHQSGARIPSIFVARARQGARRVEPRGHGLEYEEDVCPHPRLTRPCAAWRRESRRLPRSIGEITKRSGRHQTSGEAGEAKSSSAFCYKASVRRAARRAVS